jgi:hypothetical protein
MKGFFAIGKMRTCVFCFGMFIYCSPLSYGAPPQQPPEQPVASDKKSPTSVTPVKNAKKKAPKEGVKETKVGPPPVNAPPRKKKLVRRPQSSPPPGFARLVPWENMTTHRPLPMHK